ncbi:6-phosphogluconolactonase [Propionimicrobium sp. PCR01-08-3]|uniref:6-phosphogluconolactonase n=1 Tax=Propionimicrobium sp. PCR01-08-3 TaxID=3052086 RepID=UPI00255C565A|nr:6-phosphogluconolactonase [Propionimicrobium sp. PCR01-08-3]WIY81702.1 6-phosphogluconolactonase [Propionimicrobium sp. PCR01-08-3]
MNYPIHLHVSTTTTEMGAAAGARAGALIRDALATRERARVMLAAAPSQSATLTALSREPFDAHRVDFFHMDDYLGLPADAPQGFGNWLDANFISLLDGATFHRIDNAAAPEAGARAYSELMGDEPFDVVLCGLGVNGHLAFNDPPADFEDPRGARVVELTDVSRWQQVNEGHFPTFDDVPSHAITVTIPRLLNSAHMVCSVPGAEKADAVRQTLDRDPTPEVPGTALKTHPDAHLYVDQTSAPNKPTEESPKAEQ